MCGCIEQWRGIYDSAKKIMKAGLGAESDEVGIGFDWSIPFFSEEKLCGFGSELLQVLF